MLMPAKILVSLRTRIHMLIHRHTVMSVYDFNRMNDLNTLWVVVVSYDSLGIRHDRVRRRALKFPVIWMVIHGWVNSSYRFVLIYAYT